MITRRRTFDVGAVVTAGRHGGRPLDDGLATLWTAAGEPVHFVGDATTTAHLRPGPTTVDDPVTAQRSARVDLHLKPITALYRHHLLHVYLVKENIL